MLKECVTSLFAMTAITPEIFKKVYVLRNLKHWDKISQFMGKEYGIQWLNFLSKEKP